VLHPISDQVRQARVDDDNSAVLDEYSSFSAIFGVDFPSRVDYCKSVPFQSESGFYQVD
jgi:hypothetical protein